MPKSKPKDDGYAEALRRIDACRKNGEIVLNLYGLKLTEMPPELGKLTALRALGLSGNQLTSLPESIGNLTALRALGLSGNQLTSLPESIGNLTALTELNLNSNQLTSLPESISSLTKLTRIGLSSNLLTSLPEWIDKFTDLIWLDLSYNRLTSLPRNIQNLAKLQRLYLQNNPALKLSPEILGGSPWDRPESYAKAQSILDYYFGRKSKDARPLNEVKLILVGRGGAGKTSTVKSLRREPFNADELSTHHRRVRASGMEEECLAIVTAPPARCGDPGSFVVC